MHLTRHLMKIVTALFGLVCLSIASASSPATVDQQALNPHLEPLRPLLGKTWKGQFKESKPDKPTIDVARWERALNGQAVRALHSLNEGIYGGETLIIWDETKQSVVYYYFTTAGFMTTGTMIFKDGKIITHEDVKGRANGVTEVKATSEILSDAGFHIKSEYLKSGEWVPGHEVTYREDASAKVEFK